MNAIESEIEPKAVEEIKRILQEEAGSFGLRLIEVRPGEDHDGDPVIFIDADYDLSERPIDPKAISAASLRIRRSLLGMKETRFPHVRHHFAEAQKVVGYR